MPPSFFAQPILNSPYEYPRRHWELDEDGQPTGRLLHRRRKADFITPIPKPKKQSGGTGKKGQTELVFGENKSISSEEPRVRSDGPDGIACWFIDTEYNAESFFVRHADFLGANDPYKALKTTLKADINEDAWESLNSDLSRPFPKPETPRIAVKVINHLGDEVMKVFQV